MITEIRGPKEIYFIHASSSKGVREDNLISTYWMGCYATAEDPSDLGLRNINYDKNTFESQ
jgi:hypothetical protein